MHAAAESAVAAAAARKELEDEVSRYREALEMAQKEIREMSPEISSAAEENERFVTEIEFLTRDHSNLKEQLDSISQLAGITGGGSVELFIRNLREERDLLEKQLGESQHYPGVGSHAQDARLRQLEEENQRMANALAVARHSDLDIGSSSALETINTLRVKLAKIKSERDSLETEKNRLDGLVRQLEERSTRYPAMPSGMDPGVAVENKILRAEVDELRRRLAASKPDSAALEAGNLRKDELIRHLEEKVTELARSQVAGEFGDPGGSVENRVLKAEVDELRRKLAIAGPDNAIFEAEKTRLMERARHLEEENARLATSIATSRHSEYDHGGRFSRSELDEMHSQLITAKAERVSLEAERTSLSEQVRRLQEENSQMATSLASARHGSADIDTRVMRAELDELRKQLEAARSGHGSFDVERNAIIDRMGRLEEENSKLASELAAARFSQDDADTRKMRAEYKELRKQLQAAREENARLASEFEMASDKVGRTEAGTRKIRSEYKDLARQLDEAKTGRDSSSAEKNAMMERIESLEDENSQLAEELAATKLSRKDTGTRKIQAEYKELRKQLEDANEENAKLAAELATARFSRDDSETRKMRAELEVLRNQMESAGTGHESFDAERKAIVERMERLREENSKLAAELATAKFGHDDAENRKMRAELEVLRNQLDATGTGHDSFDAEREAMSKRIHRLEEENSGLAKDLATARFGRDDADTRKMRAELEVLRSQVGTTRSGRDTFEAEREAMSKRIQRLEEENSALAIELASAKHAHDDAGARKMRAELDEVRSQLSQSKSDMTTLEIEKRRFESELLGIEAERDELTVTLARARSSIAESTETDEFVSDGEKEWLRKRVKELEDEVSTLHVEIEEARTIIGEIEDTLES